MDCQPPRGEWDTQISPSLLSLRLSAAETAEAPEAISQGCILEEAKANVAEASASVRR